MKCSQCGNEVNPGAVCSVCGKEAPYDDEPTMASEPIISVKIPDNESTSGESSQQLQNNQFMVNNTMYQGGPAPQAPYQGGQPGQNPYQGGPAPQAPYQGGQPGQNPYQGGSAPQMPYQGGQPGQNPYQGRPVPQVPYQGGQPGQNPYQGAQTPYKGSNIPEEPKKSKTPFIVAGIILAAAVIAVVILLVVLLGGDDKDKDKDKEKNTTERQTTEKEEPTTVEKTTEEITTEVSTEGDTSDTEQSTGQADVSQLEGTIVFENDYIAMTLSTPGMVSDSLFYAEGQILNKTSSGITVSNDACDIGGISVDAYMYTSVEPGSIQDITLTIYASDLQEAGFTHIDDLVLYISGYNNSTYEDVFEDKFKLSCNVDTGLEPEIDTSGYKIVYEDENVIVKASDDIYHDDTYGEYYCYLYVESKMNVLTSVMVSDTYIDGTPVTENGGWEDLAPMSGTYVDVYWYDADIGDNNSFGTISAEISFFDYDTWEDYTVTTIEF